MLSGRGWSLVLPVQQRFRVDLPHKNGNEMSKTMFHTNNPAVTPYIIDIERQRALFFVFLRKIEEMYAG